MTIKRELRKGWRKEGKERLLLPLPLSSSDSIGALMEFWEKGGGVEMGKRKRSEGSGVDPNPI